MHSDMEDETSENIEIETQSLFDRFTSIVVKWATIYIRIFNIYLVCCWCQTTFAAIMAIITMIAGCSVIHSDIYNVLTKGEYCKLVEQLTTNIMLNNDVDEYINKLNKLTRDYRWVILLFQGILMCFLKFTIG